MNDEQPKRTPVFGRIDAIESTLRDMAGVLMKMDESIRNLASAIDDLEDRCPTEEDGWIKGEG